MKLKNNLSINPPSDDQLLSIYNQFVKEEISIPEIARYSQYIRFDPRLGEYFYRYFEKNWAKINPIELNQELAKQPWPAILLVVLEQLYLYERKKPSSESLSLWGKCVESKILKAENELYFIGLWKPASRFLYEEAELSTLPYLKWGFLGNQSFKKTNPTTLSATLLPLKTRKRLLKILLKVKSRITVKEYQAHLKNLISSRQAQRDLQNFAKHKAGKTRNRFYR